MIQNTHASRLTSRPCSLSHAITFTRANEGFWSFSYRKYYSQASMRFGQCISVILQFSSNYGYFFRTPIGILRAISIRYNLQWDHWTRKYRKYTYSNFLLIVVYPLLLFSIISSILVCIVCVVWFGIISETRIRNHQRDRDETLLTQCVYCVIAKNCICRFNIRKS